MCQNAEFFPGSHFPVFGLNIGKYGPEETLYLDTFHAVSSARIHVPIVSAHLLQLTSPCN